MLRDLDFVKGAVSMQTLPEASHPEIAFIGRSNVGKSSLINMFTNRKGLAFTSKTPGKTSEFNYFYSKGRVGKEQSSHEMYIVDLPGVGFADSSRVSSNKRLRWLKLFNDYVTGRPTLKMLCHLVDSRHGLLDSDMDCLKIIPYLPPNVQYTIVLTKADKKDGGVKEGMLARIKRDMNRFVNEAYEAKRAEEASGVETDGDVRNGALSVSNDLDSESTIQTRVVPIVLTSAESREGGPALWSHIMEHVASVSINMESDSADAIISKTGAAAPSAKMFDDKTLAEWTRLQGIEPVIISLGDIHG
jgi:GTP-binding protein